MNKNNITSEKNELRAKAKNIRNTLDCSKSSTKITELIKNWEIYKSAKHVMIFFPINSEISLVELLSDKTKNFYFPSVKELEMLSIKYDPNKGFQTGKYKIPEPIGEDIKNTNILNIVFLPALAADKYGHRLGYGKGYYDRFCKQLPDTTIKVIPIYNELLFNEIPYEKHDMPADYIITEEKILTVL